MAQPHVTVQMGQRRRRGLARPVEDPAERRRLLAMHGEQARAGEHGPPRPIRWLMRHLRVLDYDAELDRAEAEAEHTPAVEITLLG